MPPTLRPIRNALLVISLLALLSPTAASAATSCYSSACGTCPESRGVGFATSTLVAPGDFPAGADTPVAFVDPGDGSALRLIATQEGAILVWDGADGAMRPEFFLDLRDESGGPVEENGGERGLLALAVDPDYPTTGHLYVFYTSDSTGPGDLGDIVVERYSRSDSDPALGDPESGTPILVLDHPASNHNGGWLAFGPDGFLYVSTGDGGGFCDGNLGAGGDGQDLETLHGKLLRIDVRGVDPEGTSPDILCSNSAGPYTVPSDNPYSGQPNACDEIWALGLRNPFRFSFDRSTGDLYIGDVGQNKWEEINLQPASMSAPVNFGWVCREGCETSDNDESGCSVGGCVVDAGATCEFPFRTASGLRDPVLCHYNGGWDSIMGGYRYRGSRVASLGTSYVYGDAACGQIWTTTTLDPADPAAIQAECRASGYFGTYGFAEDRLGELYVVLGGASRIDCIHDGDGCAWAEALFLDGFESGDAAFWD